MKNKILKFGVSILVVSTFLASCSNGNNDNATSTATEGNNQESMGNSGETKNSTSDSKPEEVVELTYWDQKDNTLSEFDKSIREMAPDGKMYGLAHRVTVPVVWYNNNFLADAGLDVPTNQDEVFDIVEKTTDKSNGKYGFAIRGGAGSSQQLEQMIYQYSRITEMVAAFDSASAGIIFHNLASYTQHLNTLGAENFGGIVELSSVDGKNAIISNGAICLSVFEDSEHPAEAFKFISYLTEHEASSYMCQEMGQIPCNKLALTDDWISNAAPTKTAADALLNNNSIVITLPINITGYYDLHQNQLIEGFQNVLLKNITAQEYLDDWANEMTKLKLEYDTYLANQNLNNTKIKYFYI